VSVDPVVARFSASIERESRKAEDGNDILMCLHDNGLEAGLFGFAMTVRESARACEALSDVVRQSDTYHGGLPTGSGTGHIASKQAPYRDRGGHACERKLLQKKLFTCANSAGSLEKIRRRRQQGPSRCTMLSATLIVAFSAAHGSTSTATA